MALGPGPAAAAVALAAALGLMAAAPGQARAAEARKPPMTPSSPTPAVKADRAVLTAVLEDSARAWTRGDLDGFMRCYEDAPSTTYLKSDGVVRGYAAVRAMYAARFAEGEAGRRGRLSTELSDVRALGAGYALAIGRFRLDRAQADGGAATGVFTLVFHRGPQGWRIVSDHTS